MPPWKNDRYPTNKITDTVPDGALCRSCGEISGVHYGRDCEICPTEWRTLNNIPEPEVRPRKAAKVRWPARPLARLAIAESSLGTNGVVPEGCLKPRIYKGGR